MGNWFGAKETNWIAIWGKKSCFFCKPVCGYCWIRDLNLKSPSSYLFGLTKTRHFSSHYVCNAAKKFFSGCKFRGGLSCQSLVKYYTSSALKGGITDCHRRFIHRICVSGLSMMPVQWEIQKSFFVTEACLALNVKHQSWYAIIQCQATDWDTEVLFHRQALWGHLVVVK